MTAAKPAATGYTSAGKIGLPSPHTQPTDLYVAVSSAAVRLACACLGGFLVGGIPPLVASIVWTRVSAKSFVSSLVVYCVALIALSYDRAKLFVNLTLLQSLVEVLTLGTLAGGIAFGIANVV